MYEAAPANPKRGKNRQYGAHAHPSVLSSRFLQLKNQLTELSYHQNRAWRLAPGGTKVKSQLETATAVQSDVRCGSGGAKNGDMERTHTLVRFQVGLFS